MAHPISKVAPGWWDYTTLCFHRIRPELRMPELNIHFPIDLTAFSQSFDAIRCVLMQGGQGEVKHWAFNDPPKREGKHQDQPFSAAEYRRLKTRVTDLHPMTVIQNAQTSGGGYVPQVPIQAATVGPFETWEAERDSIWHPGHHDNPFGIRLSALMIGKRICGYSRPHVAVGRAPQCPLQLLSRGHRRCGSGDALILRERRIVETSVAR